MKLTILFSLISLTFASLSSAASVAPVDVLCNFIDKQAARIQGQCISVFDSYPSIRQSTYQGVALIGNNVAKKKLKTFITSMKRYQTMPSFPKGETKMVASCLGLMRAINQSLEDAVDLIMKRQYTLAVNNERKLVKNIMSICKFPPAVPAFVTESFKEFVVADVVAFKSILLLRPKKE